MLVDYKNGKMVILDILFTSNTKQINTTYKFTKNEK